MSAIEITAFVPEDQDAVRALILDGLEGHWGTIDPDLNPDLDDIGASYGAGRVLVARRDGLVVGAGAVVPAGVGEGEVKRLGVAREQRRSGIATALLHQMVAFAGDCGWDALVLETTASWTDAVGLYVRFGFTLTHYEDGEFGRDAWFRLEIGPRDGSSG